MVRAPFSTLHLATNVMTLSDGSTSAGATGVAFPECPPTVTLDQVAHERVQRDSPSRWRRSRSVPF